MPDSEWKPVPEFPGYWCNRTGEFLSEKHPYAGTRPHRTQERDGVWTVLLSRDGKQFRRSVVPLVERAFEGLASQATYGTRDRDANGRFAKRGKETQHQGSAD